MMLTVFMLTEPQPEYTNSGRTRAEGKKWQSPKEGPEQVRHVTTLKTFDVADMRTKQKWEKRRHGHKD